MEGLRCCPAPKSNLWRMTMTVSPELGAAQGADGRISYDLVVIGSGGAAFSAAIAARRKNKTVAMIERGTTGGTCVNTGCVPSKALLVAAEARHIAGHHPFPWDPHRRRTGGLAGIDHRHAGPGGADTRRQVHRLGCPPRLAHLSRCGGIRRRPQHRGVFARRRIATD